MVRDKRVLLKFILKGLQINCASVFHYLRLVSLCFISRLSLHPMLPAQLVNIFVCDELNLLTYSSDWLCYLNEG